VDGRTPDEIELGTMALNALVYGLLAVALWILVEVRVREVARLVEDHKQQLLAKLGPVPVRPAGGPEPAPPKPAAPTDAAKGAPEPAAAASEQAASKASEAPDAAEPALEAGAPPEPAAPAPPPDPSEPEP
jgi:hypothetical protein